MIHVTYSGDYADIITQGKEAELRHIHENLYAKKGQGSDFLGWLDWTSGLSEDFLNQLKTAAERIRKQADVLIVIGIGGSYLGAKAVIEALQPHFEKNPEFEVLFAGHQVSGSYLKQLMNYIEDKEVALNVISKSGTTTEPALAFRFLQKYMEDRYGNEAASRIYVTTDAEKGALLSLAKEKGYNRFVVPSDIGGRYSVFTSVGLLPIAAAGFDTEQLVNGAHAAEKELQAFDVHDNPAIRYAAVRHDLYEKGYTNEVLATFEPKLSFVQEWWKQLFGESEGKDHKGIFPISVVYTTDLHSLGQYIQDGKRNLLESFLVVDEVDEDLTVFEAENDADQLNYLAGTSLHDFNLVAYKGVSEAHLSGGVSQIGIHMKKLDEYHLGYLLYFYMLSCAYSAYLLDINPFNQPGVEDYKTAIFRLLKKPGY
ncbi:glucose-6-phosphate isomerase [Tenuibacillus multivorans]|uniref:Glucose-6-phosphate isomerase n=1 Tax=Tenuibacillus multivorans TaxID=237069 RepID=A0A1G9WCP5_9BACI|nr:glucose-6-phosphate isomerase [Tenuibacillus multivorans]GEL76393.1 glucose-6-phosphate isomerase [Tenuibacillus multivorans]SDM81981.1 glucose-6-phosphate isomerase [Tenuibacillus multivorans]